MRTFESKCGEDEGRTIVDFNCSGTSTVEGTGSDEMLADSIGGVTPLLDCPSDPRGIDPSEPSSCPRSSFLLDSAGDDDE